MHDPLPALTLSEGKPTLTQGDTPASILAQHCDDHLEIIVMDGGSTDGTLAVLERYRPWIHHLVSGADGGQSQAIYRGLSLVRGEVLAWINSDDYSLPGALAAVLHRFGAEPGLQFLVGAGDVVSLDNTFLRHVPPPLPMDTTTMHEWKLDSWVMQQACFWRRGLRQRVGGVDESLHLLMDYDLWFRFSKLTEAGRMDRTLAAMRDYPGAKIVRQRNRTSEETAYVYAKNGAFADLRDLLASLGRERTHLSPDQPHRIAAARTAAQTAPPPARRLMASELFIANTSWNSQMFLPTCLQAIRATTTNLFFFRTEALRRCRRVFWSRRRRIPVPRLEFDFSGGHVTHNMPALLKREGLGWFPMKVHVSSREEPPLRARRPTADLVRGTGVTTLCPGQLRGNRR